MFNDEQQHLLSLVASIYEQTYIERHYVANTKTETKSYSDYELCKVLYSI